MKIENIVGNDTQYVLGFSGGKDSVAAWLYLTTVMGIKNITCLFADTGHEFDDLYPYLDLLEREHGCPLVRINATMRDMQGHLKPEKICERLGLAPKGDWLDEPLDMERLAILKRRFPSSTVRFCTSILKLSPMRRWLRENHPGGDVINATGVRAQESAARAKKEPLSWDEYMGCYLWMPIHAWSHEDVFKIHRSAGVPVNPLYKQGMGRVGCAPCIMARKSELAAIALRKSETFTKISDMEKRVAKAVGKPAISFFSTGKTPDRFCSETCPNTGKRFPNADDVRRWAVGLPSATNNQAMFEEDWTEDAYSCQSQYGLCE